jgi:predicted TPR repeat methyltransferase
MCNLPFETAPYKTLEQGYDAWAADYDRDVSRLGYNSPETLVAAVTKHIHPPMARILDAGAGTGLVGERLYDQGYRRMVGIDSSHGMLAQAARKGVYRLLCRMVLGQPLGFADQCFDGAIAAGVFTPGHAPPEALYELIRVVRPGGWLVFSLKWDGLFESAFLDIIGKRIATNSRQMFFQSETYQSWPKADPGLQARILAICVPVRSCHD